MDKIFYMFYVELFMHAYENCPVALQPEVGIRFPFDLQPKVQKY